MIYTLKRDDMPSLSQWIKKEVTFVYQKLLLFWLRRWDSRLIVRGAEYSKGLLCCVRVICGAGAV